LLVVTVNILLLVPAYNECDDIRTAGRILLGLGVRELSPFVDALMF
jgi:hypothetical protein